MRHFSSVEGFIRSHFLIYRSIRRFAPFLCKWVSLEEGFDFLKLLTFEPSAQAIDIGANDGTSIRMIQRLAPQAQIMSFDPVHLPKFKDDSVIFHDFALGSRTGEIEVTTPIVKGVRLTQYSSTFIEDMISQLGHDLHFDKSEITLETKVVKVFRIDDLNLTPFFMKIDVEGAELEVLNGALSTIRMNLPIILIEIQNMKRFEEIHALLDPIGYFNISLAVTSNRKIEAGQYSEKYNNYVWIPNGESQNWKLVL